MIIYPNTEAVLINSLIAKLTEDTDQISNNVYVASKKPLSDAGITGKIITVRNDGGQDITEVTRIERVGINIYADTADEATNLSLTVEAYLRTILNRYIKKVEIILSPVRVDEEGTQERRYLTAEVTVKAETKQ